MGSHKRTLTACVTTLTVKTEKRVEIYGASTAASIGRERESGRGRDIVSEREGGSKRDRDII